MSQEPIEQQIVHASSAQFSRLEKYRCAVGGAICFGAFWLAASIFRIPTDPHFSGALVQQPTAMSALVVTVIVFAICVILGALACGVVGFDAGVFCACAGMCALSARGGAMRYALFDDPHANTWLLFMVELVLLGGIVWGGTLLQTVLLRAGLLHHDEHRHVVAEIRESIDQRLLALAINVIVVTLLMMLLAATDRKIQVLAAVAISSFLGTLAAYFVVPTRPSFWFWSAPIVVGVIGYALQYIGNPAGWQIGEVHGTFAALARPLPLDYASAGVAASIVGYWMSRRWQHEREISSVAGAARV